MAKGVLVALVSALLMAGPSTAPGKAGALTCFGRRATKIGTAKKDTIYGTNRNDVIVGLGGNDVLVGYTGEDLICGGPGNDLIEGGYNRDRLDGGTGKGDAVAYVLANRAVTIKMSSGRTSGAERDVFKGFEGVVASEGADKIYGTAKSDFIFGNRGRDRIYGLGGNDLLLGEESGDLLDGGAGKGDVASYWYEDLWPISASLATGRGGVSGEDRFVDIEGLEGAGNQPASLAGDAGPNGLFTGWDPSELAGNEGDDLLVAKIFDDILDGGPGDDVVVGSDGSDHIDQGIIGSSSGVELAAAGNDYLYGGDGTPRSFGDDGNDNIQGGDGDDLIHAQEGDDAVIAGLGNDRVVEDYGDDRISLGEGDDKVWAGGPGNDELAGDAGVDLVSWEDAFGSMIIDLGTGTASGHGPEKLSGFEVVEGGPRADQITGDGLDNTIYGLEGADTIAGADGNDTLDGGAGDDAGDGGLGLDTCSSIEDPTGCENLPTILPTPLPSVTGLPPTPTAATAWPLIGDVDAAPELFAPAFGAIDMRALGARINRLQANARR